MKITIETTEPEFIEMVKNFGTRPLDIVTPAIQQHKAPSANTNGISGLTVELEYIGTDPNADRSRSYFAGKLEWDSALYQEITIDGILATKKDFKLKNS